MSHTTPTVIIDSGASVIPKEEPKEEVKTNEGNDDANRREQSSSLPD
jgi:hypothetical protein